MGSFGGFYKGDKKKPKKGQLEKKAQKQLSTSGGWQIPHVDIIKKGKKRRLVEIFCPDEQITCFVSS